VARGRPPCAPKRRKRRRLGETSIRAGRRTATAPDQVWAFDFQFDVTAAGRTIKLLSIIDEFTCESSPSSSTDRSMPSRP
jgi:putative transposase